MSRGSARRLRLLVFCWALIVVQPPYEARVGGTCSSRGSCLTAEPRAELCQFEMQYILDSYPDVKEAITCGTR